MGMQIPHPLVPGPHREASAGRGGGGCRAEGAGVTQEDIAGGQQGAMQQMASTLPNSVITQGVGRASLGVGNAFPFLRGAIITGLTSHDHLITLGLSI